MNEPIVRNRAWPPDRGQPHPAIAHLPPHDHRHGHGRMPSRAPSRRSDGLLRRSQYTSVPPGRQQRRAALPGRLRAWPGSAVEIDAPAPPVPRRPGVVCPAHRRWRRADASRDPVGPGSTLGLRRHGGCAVCDGGRRHSPATSRRSRAHRMLPNCFLLHEHTEPGRREPCDDRAHR